MISLFLFLEHNFNNNNDKFYFFLVRSVYGLTSNANMDVGDCEEYDCWWTKSALLFPYNQKYKLN